MTAIAMASDGSYDPVISKLITSLKEAESLTDEKDLGFLQNLLQSKELNALVNVHSKVAKINKDDRIAPLLSASVQILMEVLELLAPRCHISPLCKEVFHLLQTPHLQSILFAHDAIAQKDFYPHLPDIPVEVDEDEETIKIVQLVKSNEPLCAGAQSAEPIVGATIKTDEETGKIIIARIMHGGAADRSGLIHVGDEVIEVNNINVEGKTPSDVLSILQNSEGTITFKLVPSDGKLDQRESKVRVRAYFDYEPENDPYIPCKEAGLGFQRGDILHIVSQDDSYWWQARKEGEKTTRAGLIPSRALQERRILHERTQKETNGDAKKGSCASICSTPPGSPNPNHPCGGPKTKKIMYDTAENDDFDREMIATYEEVAKLYPRPGVFRPIILIGSPGVGRNELKRRLVARDPEKYKSPVPYTTRPMRPGEVAGREYLFVTREKMDADIAAGKFIEHGEYKGHLYGTAADSVKSIVNAGCVCVIGPHYQALKSLRTAQLKPYIVHIRPPAYEELKKSRTKARARSTFDENNSRGFTDEEFMEMIKSDERINFLYGHFCDDEIVNDDLSEAFEKLVNFANKCESEPLWAPASWVQ
ncbi:MAGUK p55 subfamily member 7 isoform X1 [Anopheles funestus]|uniref:MAGUK p55 subfamily member 7 isoform X1 n=1 Tax=Anopheles funestus TaxID=62324 RepID=UPI0020C6C348|nr:MAGUK p55 subfamily member 7 isoform X1 [Anopheles funestus]XP_049284230.1 MAGUK p55 subfamily member 7 isoform X1 [Anopheles funestus]XP_049284231.1 MAGUK p55 subfamily member 7 isoform X1 [Anopheles funestus]XP_049284232.1 MAGUK p55 subfamily member 7 isoform X1 [Anopheles funestus]XP_049284233.1 MAGUK p55 subfamily member 7 isoform X1 [Anopheles funestus]XP_049284234.1 MAGUK p55 subfamily member 7 isoform X1 [Anopheles funestus]